MDALRKAAEQEMRRPAPEDETCRSLKRQRVDDGDSNEHEFVARYSYAAVEEIEAGAACFLVTCPIRREKSATKEATALLTPLLLGSDDGGAPTQADGSADSATASPLLRHAPLRGPLLSIVKLSGCGMALLKLADDRCMLHLPPPRAVVAAVTALLVAVASRTTPAPVHCQRIMPLQATCAATVHAVLQTAKRVAADFVAARLDDAAATASCSGDNSGPLRFAVLYHGRGQEGGTTGAAAGGASGGAAGAAGAAAAAGDHPADDHLTRSQAIDILAGALAEACASAGTGAAAATVAVGGLPPPCAAGGGAARQRLVMPPPIVDLRDPQVVFVCECVPAAGGRLVVGLSLLPVADLMAVKPKLNVRALAAAAAAAAPKQKAARGD